MAREAPEPSNTILIDPNRPPRQITQMHVVPLHTPLTPDSATLLTFLSAKLPALPCPGWNLLRRDNSFVGFFLPFLWVL